jgi:hypothetical protein
MVARLRPFGALADAIGCCITDTARPAKQAVLTLHGTTVRSFSAWCTPQAALLPSSCSAHECTLPLNVTCPFAHPAERRQLAWIEREASGRRGRLLRPLRETRRGPGLDRSQPDISSIAASTSGTRPAPRMKLCWPSGSEFRRMSTPASRARSANAMESSANTS